MVRRMLGDKKGTAAVEFALVLPMLMVLVLGTVEIGFLILSHASMNATMARVPDLARNAASAEDLDNELDAVATLRLGLGLAQVDFDPVEERWICPADEIDLAEDVENSEPTCDDGAAALRLYAVTGRVSAPSLIPGEGFGSGRPPEAVLMVLAR